MPIAPDALLAEEGPTSTPPPVGPPGVGATTRRFVIGLVQRVLEAAEKADPGAPIPEIDWSSIWAAGARAPSAERAIGRVVVAASFATSELVSRYGLEPIPASTVTEALVDLEQRASLPTDATAATAPSVEHVPRVAGLTTAREPVPSAPLLEAQSVLDAESELESPAVLVQKDSAARRRAHRWVRIFTWTRNIGALMVLFVAWQLWGTGIAEHHAQGELAGEFSSKVRSAEAVSSHAATQHHRVTAAVLLARGASLAVPTEGSVVAYLQIPRISLDQYVVEGTAEGDLAKGPGHYVGTSLPGQAGNVAIAGHRTTYGAPFNELSQVGPGDDIFLSTDSGERLEYVISQRPTAVLPTDVGVLRDFGDNRLTLTTCTPEFSAAMRLVVVARLVTKVATPTPIPSTPRRGASSVAEPARPHLETVISAGPSGWNFGNLPETLLVVAGLVVLGLADGWLARRYGRVGRWLVLGPIWIGGIYLLFQVLSGLLPANL